MDVRKTLKNIAWVSPWAPAEQCASPDAVALVRRSAGPAPEPERAELSDLIARSEAFPVRFPIDTVRVSKLKGRRDAARLRRNAEGTYPLLHERVVFLIADFLLYKRKYGSKIEKEMYKNMSIEGFVDRLLLKRAVTFMKARDQYKLLSGKTGSEGWEEVGTDQEKPPLLLKDCLSYDEMKISALLNVSGPSENINDGARKNAGVVADHDIEENAVIIGIIGPRFKRPNRMEYEDILVTAEQIVPGRGYGSAPTDAARAAYRKMWDDFYQIPSVTFAQLTRDVKLTGCSGAKVITSRWAGVKGSGFDNLAYQRRLQVTADAVLLEADARGREAGTSAFVNVIGAGLGIWKHSAHQLDAFVLAWTERTATLLDQGKLDHVSDVNFAFIQPKKPVVDLFQRGGGGDDDDVPKFFLKNDSHPRGGISVQLESRSPAARLRGRHAGKRLVLTYPWDANAHPGNEFWMGKLSSSGDSAAASATQVSELHNAHINPSVRGATARVAGPGLVSLQEYCAGVAAT